MKLLFLLCFLQFLYIQCTCIKCLKYHTILTWIIVTFIHTSHSAYSIQFHTIHMIHFSLVVFRHPSKLLPSIKLKIIKYKKQMKVQCIVYDKTTHLRISINNCKLVLLELRKEKWIFSSMISLSLMLYIGI